MKTQRLTGRSWTWTKRGLRLATGICSNSSGITSSTRSTSAWLIWYFSFQFFVAQVMEDGRPFLDMAHVITSLNRLDAGIPDKVVHQLIFAQNRLHPAFQVCLMSRDELNVLVVSYAELKNCLEQVKSKRWTSLLNIIIQSYGEVLASASTKPKHTGMHQVLSIF